MAVSVPFVSRALFAPLGESGRRRAGRAVAVLLGADAVLHAVWATGVTWPAGDARALSYGLLNADVPFTPGVLLPLVGVLGAAAAGVCAFACGWGGPRVRGLTHLVTVAVAAGLGVRAIAGVVWVFGVGADPGGVFYRLNLLLYTPVCVGFGWAAARLAGEGRSGFAGIVRRPRVRAE